MIDRLLPVGARKRFALRIRDRHNRHFAELLINRHQIGEVEPAMESCHMCSRVSARQREMKIIGMKVNDVEPRRPLEYLFEHHVVMSKRVEYIVQPQGTLARRYELRCSDRIAACEERDLVSLRHQFFGKVGNDALSTAVSPWRHTFIKRRNLGDFHFGSFVNINAPKRCRSRLVRKP
jgi:hypothetical protein